MIDPGQVLGRAPEGSETKVIAAHALIEMVFSSRKKAKRTVETPMSGHAAHSCEAKVPLTSLHRRVTCGLHLLCEGRHCDRKTIFGRGWGGCLLVHVHGQPTRHDGGT